MNQEYNVIKQTQIVHFLCKLSMSNKNLLFIALVTNSSFEMLPSPSSSIELLISWTHLTMTLMMQMLMLVVVKIMISKIVRGTYLIQRYFGLE